MKKNKRFQKFSRRKQSEKIDAETLDFINFLREQHIDTETKREANTLTHSPTHSDTRHKAIKVTTREKI